ncbi:MAG: M55 family metallopeptidase [Phycisphaerae bacterium]|nr:M55 family metallopeptidase [Phycisphaerae bacterium]
MKIYMNVDMEGASGIVHFENRKDSSIENYFHRERMRRLLTKEVNAAIEGLKAGGATEIVVNDSHGCGYNLLFEEFPPEVRIIHGDTRFPPHWAPLMDGTYDAHVLMCQHARIDAQNAILPHSGYVLNGKDLGEAGMLAAAAGYFNIPTIMITGDSAVVGEIRDLVPGVEGVVVKEALSPCNAVSLAPSKAHQLIRDGARQALERVKEIPPVTFPKPYELVYIWDETGVKKGDNLYELLTDACNGAGYKLGAKLRRKGLEWEPVEDGE